MKIRNWITTFGLVFCLIMVVWLLLGILFGTYKDFFPLANVNVEKFPKLWDVFKYNNQNFLTILTILETIIAGIIALLLYKYRSKFSFLIKNRVLKSIILTIILFIIILLFCISYAIYDAGSIYSDLAEVLSGGKDYTTSNFLLSNTISYFERYPNNLGLLWYEIIIFKIFGINVFYIYSTNIILFISSLILAFVAIYKRWHSLAKANLFLISMLLFFPIYAYVAFLYTDIIAASFFLIIFSLLIFFSKRESLPIWGIILISVTGVIGATFRANLYFVLIALIIWIVLYEKKWRKFGALIVIGIILGYSAAFNTASASLFNLDLHSKKFPASHWIRMGQNKESKGNYSPSDYKYTYNQINKKHNLNIAQDNLKDAITRIKVKGIRGNILFYNNKLSNAWGNGDFGVFNNLGIFSENKNTITEVRNTIDPIRKIKTLNPKKISVTNKAYFIRIFLNIYSRIFYIMLAIFIVNILKKRDYIHQRTFLIFTLTFVASIIFLLAWESRARYAFSIMPSLILIINYVMFKKGEKNGKF